eukprot:CAMPEP_0117419012 /NCGR_PEP_ID=MMETSP0758-20121206/679_1 /TAXON_ID=63605 /ORGANISM="Percolomonas cosmopolitus, Strain AE-1 (ATCC 50343)" /LENGTH=51 /DNA_ID=CAMNT_0005199861 /DNA_START=50 /DNA_END=201 /DNA_ORIENTATION=+
MVCLMAANSFDVASPLLELTQNSTLVTNRKKRKKVRKLAADQDSTSSSTRS